ncbi:MAG: hypothetical protein IJW46_01630 [Clostridia bacterium]|nr:hypothetical protein [Clostridia bacterium]
MKPSKTYNPYGLLDKTARFRTLSRIAVWGGAALSLVLFFALYQLLVANGAPSWLSLCAYYLSECVSTSFLFILLALAVVTVAREEHALQKRLVLQETIALVGLSLCLRMLLYYLTALIDQTLDLGGFYFNDVTLQYLTEAGGFHFFMAVLSAFFGIVTMLCVLLITLFLVKKSYRQTNLRGRVSDRMKKLPVIVYLAISTGFALINTVMTVIDIGISADFSVIFSLLLPYLEIALFTLVGYYIVSQTVSYFED